MYILFFMQSFSEVFLNTMCILLILFSKYSRSFMKHYAWEFNSQHPMVWKLWYIYNAHFFRPLWGHLKIHISILVADPQQYCTTEICYKLKSHPHFTLHTWSKIFSFYINGMSNNINYIEAVFADPTFTFNYCSSMAWQI